MSCKAAKFDPDEGRYYCDVSGDQCMYYIPNSKKCAEEYGEGPDATDTSSCCGNCVHCDFEDYYDEETCDNISGYYCTLDREEFDYDNGYCDQYR